MTDEIPPLDPRATFSEEEIRDPEPIFTGWMSLPEGFGEWCTKHQEEMQDHDCEEDE